MTSVTRGTPTMVGRIAPAPNAYGQIPRRAVLEYFSLQEALSRLNERITELESRISQEKVVVIREITKKEAKKDIRELFSTGRTLYYSDIVQELGIDLETVVGICAELEKEREIGVDASISG